MRSFNLSLSSLLCLVVLILAAGACQPETGTPRQAPPATLEVFPTESTPAQQATRLPSETNPVGVPSPTPPTQVINPQNAAQLKIRLRLTNGMILASPSYSPDGSLFLVPTGAGVFLHDGATLEERFAISAPAYPNGLAAISPDNLLLAVEHPAGVALYNVPDGSLSKEFEAAPGSLVTDLAISPDGWQLAAGFDSNQVLVWQLPGGEPLFEVPGSLMEFSPDSGLLAVVQTEQQMVTLYNLLEGSPLGEWPGEKVTFSPTGALGIQDGEAFRMYDPETGQAVQAFNGVQPAFSPDGNQLALFSLSRVHLFDTASGSRIRSMQGEYAEIPQLRFSPDGQTLAAATIIEMCPNCLTSLGPLAIWRVSDGSLVQTIEGFNFAPWLVFDPTGGSLATVEPDRLQFFNPENGAPLNELTAYVHGLLGLAFSPDSQQLATSGYPSDSARLWQVRDGKLALQLDDPAHGTNWFVGNMAFSPDGKTLAAGSDVWSLPGGEKLRQLEQKLIETYHLASSSVAFSPTEDTVLFGFLEGKLDLWDLANQSIVRSLGGYTGEVTSLSYSADGSLLASVFGYPDYTVQVWRMPEAEKLRSLRGEQYFKALFSPDGERLATISTTEQYSQSWLPAGIVRVWNSRDGELLLELPVEDVASLAYSPDSAILATGSYDGTLRLWQASAGQLLASFPAHYQPVTGLAFSPDGELLASGSQDGSAFLWGLPRQK
jgi:WD40 repeat protein